MRGRDHVCVLSKLHVMLEGFFWECTLDIYKAHATVVFHQSRLCIGMMEKLLQLSTAVQNQRLETLFINWIRWNKLQSIPPEIVLQNRCKIGLNLTSVCSLVHVNYGMRLGRYAQCFAPSLLREKGDIWAHHSCEDSPQGRWSHRGWVKFSFTYRGNLNTQKPSTSTESNCHRAVSI